MELDNAFSAETNVANRLKVYLRSEGWTLFQFVSPGGQAHFSFTYDFGAVSKTIYPDVIAHRNSEVLIGEIKPNFSEQDMSKLLEIFESPPRREKLLTVLRRRINSALTEADLRPILIHGDSQSQSNPLIDQIIIGDVVEYLPRCH